MELCHINDEGKKAMGVNQPKETLETLSTKCLHDKWTWMLFWFKLWKYREPGFELLWKHRQRSFRRSCPTTWTRHQELKKKGVAMGIFFNKRRGTSRQTFYWNEFCILTSLQPFPTGTWTKVNYDTVGSAAFSSFFFFSKRSDEGWRYEIVRAKNCVWLINGDTRTVGNVIKLLLLSNTFLDLFCVVFVPVVYFTLHLFLSLFLFFENNNEIVLMKLFMKLISWMFSPLTTVMLNVIFVVAGLSFFLYS